MLNELKTIEIFEGLSDDILINISKMMTEEYYKDGDKIFEEGELGESFYIISKGEIQIAKLIDKETENYKILAIIHEGKFFGEMSLFDGKPRSASAFAKDDLKLFRISKKDFESFLSSEPQTASILLFSIIRTITSRLRETNTELVALYETGKIIGASKNLNDMLAQITERLVKATNADSGFFLMWNEFVEEFELTYSYGEVAGRDRTPCLSNSETYNTLPIVKYISSTHMPILIKNVRETPPFPIGKEVFYYGNSIISAPLINNNKLSGIFILVHKNICDTPLSPLSRGDLEVCSHSNGKVFTNDNLNLLVAVSTQTASAVENAKHMQEETARQRLSQKYFGM